MAGGRTMPLKYLIFTGLLVIILAVYFENKIQLLQQTVNKLERIVTAFQIEIKNLNNAFDYGQSLNNAFENGQGITKTKNIPRKTTVIYNRVPKTGSTSFAGVVYDLCVKNNFYVLHVNITKNSHTLSLADQYQFVKNITNWFEWQSAFYHGHLAYVDFAKFGALEKPLYINILRKPLDRLVSYYYFLRHGDDFRPHLQRVKMGNKKTFDECVAEDHQECSPEKLWLQIPFFCGHSFQCWEPGNEWALEEAKNNLVLKYFLVGVTEELEDFVALLESSLPSMFNGALELFKEGGKSHLRKTTKKISPSEQTIFKIQNSKIWKMEEEFYNFALKHFHYMKEKTLNVLNGKELGALVQKQFKYEKIRPNKLRLT